MNLNFRGSPREQAEFHFDDRKKLEKCRSFQVIIKYSLCEDSSILHFFRDLFQMFYSNFPCF